MNIFKHIFLNSYTSSSSSSSINKRKYSSAAFGNTFLLTWRASWKFIRGDGGSSAGSKSSSGTVATPWGSKINAAILFLFIKYEMLSICLQKKVRWIKILLDKPKQENLFNHFNSVRQSEPELKNSWSRHYRADNNGHRPLQSPQN